MDIIPHFAQKCQGAFANFLCFSHKSAARKAGRRREHYYILYFGSDRAVLGEQLLNIRAADLLQQLLQSQLFDYAKVHVRDLAAVAQGNTGVHKVAHVIGAAPDLRHTAVDVEQTVDGLHTGADGILRREDRIAGRLGKLTEEGEVHGSVRNDVRAA